MIGIPKLPSLKKSKDTKTKEELMAEDFVIKTLKTKFFMLVKDEKYPRTKELTDELDFIVNTIRELEKENLENTSQG
jgi:hypothetical protein